MIIIFPNKSLYYKKFLELISSMENITHQECPICLDKIKEDFDWRRINFGYLNRNITSSIHEKVLTIKNGDFVKFISSKEKLPSNYNCNLTTNKTYTVDYIRMGYDNLLITIKDDENRRIELPYRYFSEITKMREDKISFLFDN